MTTPSHPVDGTASAVDAIEPGAIAPDTGKPGFGIYLHWPFCAAKCPYCDFNSHVRESIDESRWRAALLR